MNKLSDDERHLPVRGAVHQHLLRMGYIEERPINPRATGR